MAQIANGTLKPLADMHDDELMAQSLVQQGAIHAVSFLLKHGPSEATAAEMLRSLREQAEAIRAESKRRGRAEPFASDQTEFS